jgi:hypothetical protein
MKTGLYSNFLLTIIAVALLGILLNDLGLTRNAPFKRATPVDVMSFCGHNPYRDAGFTEAFWSTPPKGLPVSIRRE